MALAIPQWTVSSLAANIRRELGSNPATIDNRTPDRIEDLIIECGIALWNAYDWRWRRKSATLSVTTSPMDLAADFGGMDWRGMKTVQSQFDLWFAHDDQDGYYEEGATGTPRLAYLQLKASTANTWQAVFVPSPDATYSFPYWYLAVDPWTAGTIVDHATAPLWPTPFHRGWHMLALCESQRRFEKDSKLWNATKDEYMDWLRVMTTECDNSVRGKPGRIVDGYNDFGYNITDVPSGALRGAAWR